jgi:hypothetical protein
MLVGCHVGKWPGGRMTSTKSTWMDDGFRIIVMDSKENLLTQAGFRYNFFRMSYVNRATKKVFSEEAIEDHSEMWLLEKIRERNDSGEWQFYFNEPPSPAVVRDILAEIDEQRAAS